MSEIIGSWGINGNTPIDRLAETGYLKFALDNTTGKFSPNTPNALAGWKKGTEIKLVIRFLDQDFIKFFGRVDELDIDSGTTGLKTALVRVNDWIDYASKYPLNTPSVQVNKRGDEIINTILESMPTPPKSKRLDVGENVFPSAFDSVGERSKALTEINKVVLSELGRAYLQKDRVYGETLVFESETNRNGLRELSAIPLPLDESGKLLTSDGSFLTTHDGSRLILGQTSEFISDNTMQGTSVTYGESLINQFVIRAFPKKIDTSLQVLFSLDAPLLVPSTATITFEAGFHDPNGGKAINGINLQAPVATTDYLMNTAKDGSGTDITSDLIITAEYSSQGVKYTLTNQNIQGGYIIKLNVRGFGIYPYNPIEVVVEDTSSVENYGYSTQIVDQKLKTSLTEGFVASKTFLEMHKEPDTILRRVDFLANTSENLMNTFLYLDVGSLVGIKETKTGIDGHYYISSVSFNIALGGIIRYSWGVTESLSLKNGLSKIGLHLSENTKQAVNFDYIPRLCNLPKRTYMAWVKIDTLNIAGSGVRYVMGINSDYAGTTLYAVNDGKFRVYTRNDSSPGRWETIDSCWSQGVWVHVAMTRDVTYLHNIDPLVYVNGQLKNIIEQATPTGSPRDETGCLLVLGNSKTRTIDYAYPLSGSMYDARIYNRILSQSEINDIYLGFDNDDGLIFQGACVKTRELSKYDGQTLTSGMNVIDNVYGSIGIPNENPTGEIVVI